MSQIFKIRFQTSDINLFVFSGVISVIYFQMKNSFYKGKHLQWNLKLALIKKKIDSVIIEWNVPLLA